jgi:hypothetical protein
MGAFPQAAADNWDFKIDARFRHARLLIKIGSYLAGRREFAGLGAHDRSTI